MSQSSKNVSPSVAARLRGKVRGALGAVSRMVNRTRLEGVPRQFHAEHLKFLSSRHPIFVYSILKTGSLNIYHSLQARRISQPVYHAHWLSTAALERRKKRGLDTLPEGFKTPDRQLWKIERTQYHYDLVRGKWDGQSPRSARDKHWKVITLVRDPVARLVSEAFTHIPYVHPDWDFAAYTPGQDELSRFFEDILPELPDVDAWFGEEMREVFGVDVFATPFPKESAGYLVYPGERADLLLIKLEQLDACSRQAFADFLGLTDFSLLGDNKAEDKLYADSYREFKRHLLLSDAFLDRMYGMRYVAHFYTPAEVESFRARWPRR